MDTNAEPEQVSADRYAHAPAAGLRDLLSVVFFYRRSALLTLLGVFAVAALLALLLPPSFTARARLLTLSAGVYEMQARQGNAPAEDSAAAVNVEMQLLASQELHRSLARNALGPAAGPDAISQWVRQFEAHLHLARIESSNVIELTYNDRDPEHAADSLRLLLAGYFQERANVLTSGRVAFLAAQRDKIREQLNSVDAQVTAYEQQNGVVDVTDQVSGAVTLDNRLREQQQEAEATLADNQKNVVVLLAKLKDVPSQMEFYSDDTEATHTLGTMQASLLELESKRADLASRYMVGSPFVQQADEQIATLKKTIAEQQKTLAAAHRTGHNTNHDTVENEAITAEASMAGAAARRNELSAQVGASSGRLKSLIAVSDTLTRLHAQHDLLAEQFKNYSEQVEQARVEQNQATTAGGTNVRVVEAPVAPSRRNNPPLLMLAAGLVSALLITAVTVFLLSSLRETFLSPQEAERGLGLPVLCALPAGAEKDASLRRYFGPVVAAIGAEPSRDRGKVILLLAPNARAGLDLTGTGLLAALEARNPGRNMLLALTDSAEAVPKPGGAGSGPGVRTFAVDGPREQLDAMLRQMRGAYDCILVTAPPVSGCFESVEVSSLADAVLLVVQAEQTRKAVAETAIAQVSQMRARVDWVVLTGRRYHIPGWAYRLMLNQGLQTT